MDCFFRENTKHDLIHKLENMEKSPRVKSALSGKRSGVVRSKLRVAPEEVAGAAALVAAGRSAVAGLTAATAGLQGDLALAVVLHLAHGTAGRIFRKLEIQKSRCCW